MQKGAKKCDSFPVTRCGDAAERVDASDSNLRNEKAKLQGLEKRIHILYPKPQGFEYKKVEYPNLLQGPAPIDQQGRPGNE
jgi:hypothetical protein